MFPAKQPVPSHYGAGRPAPGGAPKGPVPPVQARPGGANQYLKNRTSTATPAQLVALLYDGLLASLRRAQDAFEGDRRDVASDQLLRAQRIIVELRCSLNFEAGEMARNLDAIYDFAYRQVIQANVRRDPAKVAQVVGLIVPLRDAWGQAMLGEGHVERIPA